MTSSSVRRAVLRIAALLLFLILAGATYQGATTALERHRFAHPGRFVDIGGHQLHIYCTGSGTPTVVLEAPAAGMSATWAWVQPAIEKTTRVCSYDRAGLGWSQAGSNEYEPSGVAEQLVWLLHNAGEPPPYVIAGHGLGAALATLDAARLGGDVAGLVLIDPPSAQNSAPIDSMVRTANAWPWLARTGILRATGTMSENADGLPEPAAGALAAFLNRPDHLARAAREITQQEATVRLAMDAPLRRDLPVIRRMVMNGDRIEFLTDTANADLVSATIVGLLSRIRAGAPNSP